MAASSVTVRRLLSGMAFGVALYGAGMHEPATIKAQMRLDDFRMVNTMLTATAISAVIFYYFNRWGGTAIDAKSPINLGLFPYSGNVLGGALLGVGMALTGACPGSALVQAGTGVATGLWTIVGGIIGSLLYVTLEPVIRNASGSGSTASPRSLASSTVQSSFGISRGATIVGWEAVVLLGVTLLESIRPHPPTSRSPWIGGLMMGVAQLINVVLTKNSIGSSAAYEEAARYLMAPSKRTLASPSLVFAAGAVLSSALVNMTYFHRPLAPIPASALFTHVFGGAVLLFGARLAKGCPSGHGLSGISTFGWASFITMASAFAAAIAIS